uniref:Rhombotin 1 n=1 Tax=Rhipicephalus appendiculatus TaxID=34631 RepID=A0A131Z1Z1_RHIAP
MFLRCSTSGNRLEILGRQQQLQGVPRHEVLPSWPGGLVEKATTEPPGLSFCSPSMSPAALFSCVDEPPPLTYSPFDPMMDIKAEVHRWNPEVHRSPVLGPGPGSGPVPMMTPAALSHSGPECAGCQKPIRERFLLKALDQLWHEDCLKCACCDCRLGEVGSTLFTKANLILCKRDYLRLFGTTGLCSACSKTIPAFEMVMRARGNVYHLECFACQHCNHRFCVGDRFYLLDNKILCEYDYEERLSFQNVPFPGHNPSNQQQQQQQQNSNNASTPGSGGGGGNGSISNHQSSNAGSNSNSGPATGATATNNSGRPPIGTPPGSAGGPNANNGNSNSLQRLKRHTLDSLPVQDDASSGYGSPDSMMSDGK